MHPTLTLTHTVFTLGQLKEAGLAEAPQIALAGRSNVGKSSLVNSLAGRRKNIARVSSAPGKTRSLNFFAVTPGDFVLVDLPGYGYAKCAKTEREKWAALTHAYLTQTPGLRGVVSLLDSRHEPQRLDLELLEYLHAHRIPVLPVLTKADKCNQKARAQARKHWKTALPGAAPLFCSSVTGEGKEALWELIRQAVQPSST